MRHLRKFNESKSEKMVYYTEFHSDYTKEEQDILREYTDASQNGYADLIDVYELEEDEDAEEDDNEVNKMLLSKGYLSGDSVIIHYKW